MTIVTIEIDLAKNVFAVHGVDTTGKPVLIRPSVPRTKLVQLIVSLPPCLIDMAAWLGAHYESGQTKYSKMIVSTTRDACVDEQRLELRWE